MTNHEATAKAIVKGVGRMFHIGSDLEQHLVAAVAAALAEAVDEQKQLGQIAYEQWQTELATSQRYYEDALVEIKSGEAVKEQLRAKLAEAEVLRKAADDGNRMMCNLYYERGLKLDAVYAEREELNKTKLMNISLAGGKVNLQAKNADLQAKFTDLEREHNEIVSRLIDERDAAEAKGIIKGMERIQYLVKEWNEGKFTGGLFAAIQAEIEKAGK